MGRRSRHENCDVHTLSNVDDLTCLSMDVRDCIRYQNALKHLYICAVVYTVVANV